jgi:hypothetical protein
MRRQVGCFIKIKSKQNEMLLGACTDFLESEVDDNSADSAGNYNYTSHMYTCTMVKKYIFSRLFKAYF